MDFHDNMPIKQGDLRRSDVMTSHVFNKAVAIDTNLLVALRATDLLSTPTPSRDHTTQCDTGHGLPS